MVSNKIKNRLDLRIFISGNHIYIYCPVLHSVALTTLVNGILFHQLTCIMCYRICKDLLNNMNEA